MKIAWRIPYDNKKTNYLQMKKYQVIIGAFFSTICCIIFLSMTTREVMKSNGGPPYNTNAPGEKTCSGVEGTNSCHSGGGLDNSGAATKSITFSGGTSYIPGQTYTVTVSIAHPTRNRFGFQIVSLKNSNNANAGTVVLTDTARTQSQIPGYGSYQTRNYVMHKLAGTNGIANADSWSYNWTAPSANQGAITFYASLMAANNNNTNDAGDETYFTQFTIYPSATSVSNQESENDNIAVYPNPISDFITIDYLLKNYSSFEAELVDIQGKTVQPLLKLQNTIGLINKSIAIDQTVSSGIYLVKFTIDKKALFTKRIIITR
jgi:hypothetical protein